MIVAGAGATGTYTIVGILRFGGGESFGGAGAALLLPAEAQRLLGQPGRFDQIDVAARPGVTPDELRDQDPRRAAWHGRRADRLRTGHARHQQPRTQPRRAAHLPSDLRLRRAGRRRFHHLQHLLDHRRAARARTRPAAHARRLAAPDPQLGRLRKPHARGARGGARPARRDRCGAAARPALQSVRRDAAGQRHRDRDAHGRRLAAGRHRRHGARRARARAARDPCAARGRDARGRIDPAAPAADAQMARDPLRGRRARARGADRSRRRRDRRGADRDLGVPRRAPVRAPAARRSTPAAPLPDRAGARSCDRPARPLARDHRSARRGELGPPARPHARDRARR